MERDPQDKPDHSGGTDFSRLASEFEALRELSVADREAALASLSEREPALTTELRRLFEQHSADPEELASPAQAFGAAEVEAAVYEAEPDAPAPETIGPYRTIRELGRGGMGTVYLCERSDSDFTNRVAIKLLRAPLDDRDMQRRFRTERRILAGLKHPNIAAMFDGGTTDAGQPYVVMEYVDGPDLLTFCREQQLPLADRLRLFVKVCRAVAHAHRALVVHRDLKPSNILVGAGGEPKLLDFGIAKLLQNDEDTAASIALTRTGNMLLTPEYSSPEQVRGDPITTATDVYALGTLLYEMLSGRRAQPLENRSLTQLIEVVCERTPPPPSVAAEAGTKTRMLRGDLDTIVACAMRKEPDRRYGTVGALADDIESHLAGMPVTAQGDTLGYRARKFVKRHRMPLGAAVILLALLVSFAVTTALQNERIAEERDEAVTQRVAADGISEFLVDLFTMASPDPERAEKLLALDLLDRGARRIDTEIESAPHRRAPLQLAMARAYVALGKYDRAAPLAKAAERTLAAHSPDSTNHRTAQHWCGILAFFEGRIEDGERLVRGALEPDSNGELPSPSTLTVRLGGLSSWMRDAGRFDEADELLDRAEQVAVEHGLDNDLDDLHLLRAEVIRDRGEIPRALAMLEQMRAKAVEAGDEGHPRNNKLHRELGRTYKELGNLEGARRAFDSSLTLTREFAGEEHPDVDAALFWIAMLEIDQGDYQRAETVLREIMLRDEGRFGSNHAYPALSKSQLASVVGNLDRFEEAEQLFLESLAVQREVLPAKHPELPTTISNFATLYMRNGIREKAGPLMREAYELRRQIYPEHHSVVLTSRNSLAVYELDSGNFEAAIPEFRAVLELRRQHLGDHVQVAGSLLSLATALMRSGKPADSIPMFEDSMAIFDRLTPGHPTNARPRIGLAFANMRLEQHEKGIPSAQEAVEINQNALGDAHFQTYYAEFTLARCEAGAKLIEQARPRLRDLVTRMEKTHPGHRLLSDIKRMLASLGG